jgi:hypothetical protein
MRKSATLLGESIPYVEAVHRGKRQRPTAVLIRTSWTTDLRGAANGVAQAWHNPYNRIESCHYVIDEAVVLRCIPDKIQAFPTKANHKGAISINVCYDPPVMPMFTTMCLAAEQTARLCKLYRIPVRLLSEADEERWMKHKWRSRGGIILKTAGDFPTEKFFASVEEYKGF